MARDPSRTEQATPKRIRDAREKGNVAKSQEVTKAVSILAGLLALFVCMGLLFDEMTRLFRYFLSIGATAAISDAGMAQMGMWISLSLAKMLLPVLLIITAAAFISLRAQVGKLWTTKVFEFKLEKFNPINGLKRMFFSLQTFIRLGKSLLQALFIGLAPLLVIKKEMPNFADLYYMDAFGVAVYILSISSKMVIYALVPMIAIAAADWWYTRWDYQENLKMTKDEVKDEHRQQEGDPQMKRHIRQKMMRMSARRMMQQIPKADVVITNPTHIAVALRYNAMEAPAPVVVAMGVDRVAEKIREIAREHHIPIRENKALARALYKQTEVGDTIPAELFQAVAIILAQIWKTKPPRQNPVS
ncbi:MAG: flagellar biosynthesis protein FlhB [Desulfovibrio sp.]|jgi:flagellar biosynthetic protein FlhB|nr:flagellar biosynthesis protein FlhB [Desulfovibrio sp.]